MPQSQKLIMFQRWPAPGTSYTRQGASKSESPGHFKFGQRQAPLMLTWQFYPISTWLLEGKLS